MRSPPTRRRTAATDCSMIDARVQLGRARQTPNRKAASTSVPRGVCTTSGWNCTPKRPAARFSMAATGERGGGGSDGEAGRGRHHRVPVAHPDGLGGWQALEQQAVVGGGQLGLAELGCPGAGHLAPEHLGQQLVAVADAQDGDAQFQDPRVEGVGVLGVHRGRAAGEDDAHRCPGGHVGSGDAARHDLREDPGLPHPAGDEAGVLRPEVEYQDPVEAALEVGHPMPIPWWRCSALPSVCREGATMISAFWNSLTSA